MLLVCPGLLLPPKNAQVSTPRAVFKHMRVRTCAGVLLSGRDAGSRAGTLMELRLALSACCGFLCSCALGCTLARLGWWLLQPGKGDSLLRRMLLRKTKGHRAFA